VSDSIGLQIQAAIIAAYNLAPLPAGVTSMGDVHPEADVLGQQYSTTIVMGIERVDARATGPDGPTVERTMQFLIVHRVMPPDDNVSAAKLVDPLKCHTVARLVGNTLNDLVVRISERGTEPQYAEHSRAAKFIQALDVTFTTARNDLTQSA